MRKPVVIALIAAVVLLLGASGVLYQKYRKTSADLTDMQSAEQTARTSYAEAVNDIAEIQDSLNAITLGSGSVQLRTQGFQAEQRLTEANRRDALERISLLSASIQRTKEKIRQLESNLEQSGYKVAGLQKMISKLKQSVVEREEQIAGLTGQVDSLQTRVAGLETTVQEKQDTLMARDQTLEERRRELGTIYYVVGTKKALEESGVIVARGGVLGLGKTVTLSGKFNESAATAVDTDQETTIRTPATKAVVLSPQPAASYELRILGDQLELHILDPSQFRKVKHLVIMTT
jgi:peptidoglycan hydrolase CwlO-like protein